MRVCSVWPHVFRRQPGRMPRCALRLAETAVLLGVSRSTLYPLVATGEVLIGRIGRSVRIARAALERLALT